MAICSKVIADNGIPSLFVNGEKQTGMAYVTYIRENACYEDFARAGYRLYSTCVYFGSNYLQEVSKLPVFSKGIFDDEDNPDFSGFDADMERLLAACPDAMVLPRVNVNASHGWEKAHPDELCDENPPPRDPDHRRFCIASDVWAETVKRQLEAFVRHVESMPYADHVIGYQLAGGATDEWFSLDGQGSRGLRSRERFLAYCKETGRENSEVEFYRFMSRLTAERIVEFSRHVKRLTDNRLVVGAFYGYSIATPHRNSLHHSFRTVLESPYVDFICSPISYATGRRVGVDHSYQLALHSVQLHGKLLFSETDIRSHLTRPVNDSAYYSKPIWFGPPFEETIELLKMHFAKPLINRHALWWFDMWGGWYRDSRYMSFMKKAKELREKLDEVVSHDVCEVAVFWDEDAPPHVADVADIRPVSTMICKALGYVGAPYALYLASDFEKVRDKYRAYIGITPYETDTLRDMRKYAADTGREYLAITKENAEITPEELRAFFRRAGAFLYAEQDCVVYASREFLCLHTATDGEQSIHLPEGESLEDLLEGGAFDTHFVSERGKTYFLRRRRPE